MNDQSSPSWAYAFFRRCGWLAMIATIVVWGYGIFLMESEKHQGEVYRILYVHVPCALASFVAAFGLLVQGAMSLRRWEGDRGLFGKVLAEVGLLFTLLTLITGSLWGRPTWGVWWTWDARLTTTLVLGLLYAGYLFLWSTLSSKKVRTRACALLGVLIALDVPLIYKSVTWWRTLHQPPSLFTGRENLMAPEIAQLLYVASFCVLCVMAWLSVHRFENLKLEEKLRLQEPL